jgi:hypothetical protein
MVGCRGQRQDCCHLAAKQFRLSSHHGKVILDSLSHCIPIAGNLDADLTSLLIGPVCLPDILVVLEDTNTYTVKVPAFLFPQTFPSLSSFPLPPLFCYFLYSQNLTNRQTCKLHSSRKPSLKLERTQK